jgi:aspartyl/asparaginyl beta-hydroxylase (cupin superfamily)
MGHAPLYVGTAMTFLIVAIVAILVVLGLGLALFGRAGNGSGTFNVRDSLNGIFTRAEARQRFPRLPPFYTDYARDYPGLAALEADYPAIRDEVIKLLDIKDKIVDMENLVGGYTAGGIHAAKWKSFLLKSGFFVGENCKLAPRTAAAIRRIPGVQTAFFSILDPNQHIKPHWGYWKGFLRYHLGVVVPNNNANNECWLRVNAKPEDNAKNDRGLIENGEKYYWHNGEGVIFDDTFLHDAANGSNEIRVVLWLDLRRKMPWHLSLLNRTLLLLAELDPNIRGIRKNAVIKA